MPPPALFAALLFASPARAGAPTHEMDVRLEGPVALFDVRRALAPGKEERVLDLDLPAGATALDWEIEGAGSGRRLAASSADARARHARFLEQRGVRPSTARIDEGTAFRVRVAGGSADAPVRLRYRFTAPARCERGRFVVRMPPSLEEDPVAAHVTVRSHAERPVALSIAGEPVRLTAGVARGRAPARAPWELGFAYRPHLRLGLQAAARRAGSVLAIGLCRAPSDEARPPPDEVLLLIDRSRSVGLGGMAAQRDLARAVIEALPPAVTFNAILFDRTAERLFPAARASTREALLALEEAASPAALRNGSDFAAALRAAAEARGPGQGGRLRIVLLTDGAIPERQDADALARAAARLPQRGVELQVVVVRAPGEDPPPPAAWEALASVAARFGGVLRQVGIGGAADTARSLAGSAGDLFLLSAEAGSWRRTVAAAVLAGEGASAVWTLPHAVPPVITLRGRMDGADVRTELTVRAVRTLAPPADSPTVAPRAASPRTWALETPALAVLVEPGPPAPPADGPIRGEQDRQVVRNALSLAYLPRARACYLNRPVKEPGDLNLRGRVRVELELERGEMLNAAIRSSTLGRREIESCLRDAAYSLDVPRPMYRDAPVVAALNLVFQPRSPPPGGPDAGALFDRIDVLLGPIDFPADPRALLDGR